MSNNRLIDHIDQTLRIAQTQALKMLNEKLLTTNWTLGKLIFESEKQGPLGQLQFQQLSESLRAAYGLNLDTQQLELYRKFYNTYPIFRKISLQLTWGHYIELMHVDDELARAFYQRQTEKGEWDSLLLKRQIDNGLFEKFKNSEHKNNLFVQDLKSNKVVRENQSNVDIHLQNFLNF